MASSKLWEAGERLDTIQGTYHLVLWSPWHETRLHTWCPLQKILSHISSLRPLSPVFQSCFLKVSRKQLANTLATTYESVWSYIRPSLFPYKIEKQMYYSKFCLLGRFLFLQYFRVSLRRGCDDSMTGTNLLCVRPTLFPPLLFAYMMFHMKVQECVKQWKRVPWSLNSLLIWISCASGTLGFISYSL